MSTSHDLRARRAAVSALCTVALLATLSSCAGSEDTGGNLGTSPSTVSSSPDGTDDAPRLVDIGGDRHVYAQCIGSGSPTVVLESGDESDQSQWNAVIRRVSAQTRVCAYDRLGNGSSDAATGCRRTPELLADLEALLAAVDAKPPYVLVGTSGGGFLVTSFAYAHPHQVGGIVLAETPHAIIPAQAPKELLAELDCDASANQEHRDYVAVERYAWTHRHRLGRIPMTIITNDYRGSGTNEEEQTNVKGQQGWLVLSPLARQIVVSTGHDVPENEPDLTVSEILRVLRAARN